MGCTNSLPADSANRRRADRKKQLSEGLATFAALPTADDDGERRGTTDTAASALSCNPLLPDSRDQPFAFEMAPNGASQRRSGALEEPVTEPALAWSVNEASMKCDSAHSLRGALCPFTPMLTENGGSPAPVTPVETAASSSVATVATPPPAGHPLADPPLERTHFGDFAVLEDSGCGHVTCSSHISARFDSSADADEVAKPSDVELPSLGFPADLSILSTSEADAKTRHA